MVKLFYKLRDVHASIELFKTIKHNIKYFTMFEFKAVIRGKVYSSSLTFDVCINGAIK